MQTQEQYESTNRSRLGLPWRADRVERELQLAPTCVRLKARIADHYLSEFLYHVWIEPLRLVDADERRLWIAVPNQLTNWTRERYGELLERAALDLAGHVFEVRLIDVEAL